MEAPAAEAVEAPAAEAPVEQEAAAPEAATEWVLTSDEANAHLVAATAARADRVVVNGSSGWHLADSGS